MTSDTIMEIVENQEKKQGEGSRRSSDTNEAEA
jgi:hypothetical protein